MEIKKILLVGLVFTLCAIVGITTFSTLRQQSNLKLSQGHGSENQNVSHHDEENVLLLSLSEASQTNSRFMLRATTRQNSGVVPTKITLTKTINSDKISFPLTLATKPYSCTDTHDYNKNRTGFESDWISGSLSDYKESEIIVTINTSDGSSSQITLPLTHSCTVLSEDFGQMDLNPSTNLPYPE